MSTVPGNDIVKRVSNSNAVKITLGPKGRNVVVDQAVEAVVKQLKKLSKRIKDRKEISQVGSPRPADHREGRVPGNGGPPFVFEATWPRAPKASTARVAHARPPSTGSSSSTTACDWLPSRPPSARGKL